MYPLPSIPLRWFLCNIYRWRPIELKTSLNFVNAYYDYQQAQLASPLEAEPGTDQAKLFSALNSLCKWPNLLISIGMQLLIIINKIKDEMYSLYKTNFKHFVLPLFVFLYCVSCKSYFTLTVCFPLNFIIDKSLSNDKGNASNTQALFLFTLLIQILILTIPIVLSQI